MDSSDSDDFNFIFFTTVMAIAAFADKKSKKAKEASRAAMVELEKSTGISGGGGGNSSRSRFKVVNAGPDDTIPLKLKRRRVVLPRPDYAEAPWSRMLRQEGKSLEDHKSTEASSFLRLFRVPYAFFVKLVSLAKTRKWFPIAQIDVSGRPCIPVELKVLAVLHTLGTGKTDSDEVRRNSYMSPPTQQVVFQTFCKHLVEELYNENVHFPTGAALSKVMGDYHEAGFTGAVGSTDVIQIIRWDFQRQDMFSPRRSSVGKEACSTVAYRVTVDRTGRVLAVSTETRNVGVKRLQKDCDYSDREYQLRGEGGELVSGKGVYLLVANGYQQSRETQEATRHPQNTDDGQYSEALEDVRIKDVKKFLGTLKGRFRILKLLALNRKKDSIDNMIFASCILHNMLRDYGELEAGMDWAGVDGLHDAQIRSPTVDVSCLVDPGCDDALEVEPAHDELKRQLITSYVYRQKHKDIAVLPGSNSAKEATKVESRV